MNNKTLYNLAEKIYSSEGEDRKAATLQFHEEYRNLVIANTPEGERVPERIKTGGLLTTSLVLSAYLGLIAANDK